MNDNLKTFVGLVSLNMKQSHSTCSKVITYCLHNRLEPGEAGRFKCIEEYEKCINKLVIDVETTKHFKVLLTPNK